MGKYGQSLKTVMGLLTDPSNITGFEARIGGIANIGYTFLVDDEDIKIIEQIKSDTSKTMVIIYRVGCNSDEWLMWRPIKTQLTAMSQLAALYQGIDEYNKVNKNHGKGRYFTR